MSRPRDDLEERGRAGRDVGFAKSGYTVQLRFKSDRLLGTTSPGELWLQNRNGAIMHLQVFPCLRGVLWLPKYSQWQVSAPDWAFVVSRSAPFDRKHSLIWELPS